MTQFRRCTSSSVDRGWAWIILVGSTVEYFITVGMFKTFGIFFVEYQRKFSTSSSVISLVLSIQTVISSISSLFLMGLGMRYLGKRALIISAAFLGLGSNIGNAFAMNASFLFFSQSTLYALSVSFAHLPCTIVLGEYFEKRRGLANAVANLGASVGGLIWAPLIVYLLEQYDLQGTLIIIGGVYLHFIPIGLIMRDLELTGKKFTYKTKQPVEDNEKPSGDIENSNEFNEQTSEKITTHVEPLIDRATNMETDRTKYNRDNKKNFMLQISKTIFDVSLLQNKCFLLLMASSFLIAAPSAIPITYIPPFGSDRGLEINKLGYIVTMSGASEIVGNIIFIFISTTSSHANHCNDR